ncbi:hypothetical protein BAPKO_4510 (plasmid) [Borreliella afzelii PKo]|nr:hypothetical protein BAPKO_4510 [Borreliella afzelii PKo]
MQSFFWLTSMLIFDLTVCPILPLFKIFLILITNNFLINFNFVYLFKTFMIRKKHTYSVIRIRNILFVFYIVTTISFF